MKFTERNIAVLNYEGTGNSRDVRWSDAVPRFGVRLYPTGRKSYVINYRINGRQRMMVIGSTADWTLKKAEKEAKGLLTDLDRGVDPLSHREASAAAADMGYLFDRYIEHAKLHKKTWKEDERRINKHLMKWKSRKVESITTGEVERLHNRIGKTARYEANRVLALVSVLFTRAIEWGMTTVNPVKTKPFSEKSRSRFVTPEELPRLMAAVDAEDIYPRTAIWLYLLTGARKSEILKAKWADVDTDRRELKLGDTKNGSTYFLPLSAAAIEVIEKLPRITGNPYLLPGLKAGQHLINIDKAWRRARTAAGCEDIHLHDLRRTVGSWMAQSGKSLYLIGKVLNHKNNDTTRVYARFLQDDIREALDSHAEQVMGVLNGTNNVTAIRK